MNDRKITNASFIQVNQLPQIDSHSTAMLYVDNSLDEPSLVRKNQNNDSNNFNPTNIISITLNTQAVNDGHVITKAYVKQFHQENEQSRRDVGLDFYDESRDLMTNNPDNDFNDKKIPNIDFKTVIRKPTLDNEVSNKNYIDNDLDKNTLVIFNRTEETYLKVSVGDDTYNLSKNIKIQTLYTTVSKTSKKGGSLLPCWNINCIDKTKNGKLYNRPKQTAHHLTLELHL